MADIIIIAALGTAVFFILRGQYRRLRRGECAGGCPSCAGGGGCSRHLGYAGRGAADASGEKAL